METKDSLEETALVKATENTRAPLFDFLIGLPRTHPIDFYYDDLSARRVYEDKGLEMRERLLQLGLTDRFGNQGRECGRVSPHHDGRHANQTGAGIRRLLA